MGSNVTQTSDSQDVNSRLLLQHGLFDSADGSVMNDVYRSPAFYLSDQGYDVWIGKH